MDLFCRFAAQMALAAAFVTTAAVAQQASPNAGKTAYHCDRNGSIFWSVEPCAEGQQLLRTGRLRDNGTIDDGSSPAAISVAPEAERALQATAAQPGPAQAEPSETVQTHRFGYIKSPVAWLLGFAFAFGLFGKMLGRSFTRWAVVGALTEFLLVALDLHPFK